MQTLLLLPILLRGRFGKHIKISLLKTLVVYQPEHWVTCQQLYAELQQDLLSEWCKFWGQTPVSNKSKFPRSPAVREFHWQKNV